MGYVVNYQGCSDSWAAKRWRTIPMLVDMLPKRPSKKNTVQSQATKLSDLPKEVLPIIFGEVIKHKRLSREWAIRVEAAAWFDLDKNNQYRVAQYLCNEVVTLDDYISMWRQTLELEDAVDSQLLRSVERSVDWGNLADDLVYAMDSKASLSAGLRNLQSVMPRDCFDRLYAKITATEKIKKLLMS